MTKKNSAVSIYLHSDHLSDLTALRPKIYPLESVPVRKIVARCHAIERRGNTKLCLLSAGTLRELSLWLG
jgi:hypothetical protein